MIKAKMESTTQMLMKKTKDSYNEINFFRKGYSPRLSGCNKKEDNLFQSEEEISERWEVENYQELLNKEGEDRK